MFPCALPRLFLAQALCLLMPASALPALAQSLPPAPNLVVTHSLLQLTNYDNVPTTQEGTSPDSLTVGTDGYLYGTSLQGGPGGQGDIFRVNLDGSGFTVLAGFSYNNSAYLPTSVVQATDGTLYGTTNEGSYNGNSGYGTIYRFAAGDANPTVLHFFGDSSPNIDGLSPAPGLIAPGDDYLYGASTNGGLNNTGTLFKISEDGTAFITLHTFAALDGLYHNGDGAGPSALKLGPDGALYGTTAGGGPTANGTFFKIKTDGTGFAVLTALPAGMATIYTGNVPEFIPNGILTLGRDSLFYGATRQGGTNGTGSLFRVAPDGSSLQTLHTFPAVGTTAQPYGPDNTDGENPLGLTEGADGLFYGTAYQGGENAAGTVFQISADGSGFRLLHTFSALTPANNTPTTSNPDGGLPESGLVAGPDGRLYGTASVGGANDQGDIFRLVSAQTYLLWNKTDGTASLWTIDSGGNVAHHEYGPYAGWTAQALTTGPDGVTHLLWNHTSDGEIALWAVDPTFAFTDQTYGPYSGWAAQAVSVGPDSLPHLLWNNSGSGGFGSSVPNGEVALWDVAADGTFSFHDYGPYAGYKAVALATGGDSRDRILWDGSGAGSGDAAFWNLDSATGDVSASDFTVGNAAGPGTARAASVGPDNSSSLLYDLTDGSAFLASTSPIHAAPTYGPFAGWTAIALATGPDNLARLLWNKTDGTASVWNVNQDGTYTHTEYGPFPDWSVVAVSAGP